jgi:predicted rRNA methylase YqxC with S4 and FtsJ domains
MYAQHRLSSINRCIVYDSTNTMRLYKFNFADDLNITDVSLVSIIQLCFYAFSVYSSEFMM